MSISRSEPHALIPSPEREEPSADQASMSSLSSAVNEKRPPRLCGRRLALTGLDNAAVTECNNRGVGTREGACDEAEGRFHVQHMHQRDVSRRHGSRLATECFFFAPRAHGGVSHERR